MTKEQIVKPIVASFSVLVGVMIYLIPMTIALCCAGGAWKWLKWCFS